VDPQLPRRLTAPGRLVGLAAQGWLRRRIGDRVVVGPVERQPAWLAGDVVFVSEEDVTNPEAVSAWLEQVPLVVLTRAGRGCTLWTRDARHDLPALASHVVDPTGAGDVFAAAFLVQLSESRDALGAARFANAAAALAVRGAGLEGIAGRDEIAALLRAQTPVTAR
jgi:sugar/nucleoside kinase (ribokinase family)